MRKLLLLAVALVAPVGGWAQPISQLPPIPSVSAADYTIMVVPGSPNVDYRATVAQIFTTPAVTGGMTVAGGLVTDTLTIGGVAFVPPSAGSGTPSPGSFSTLTTSGDATIGGALNVSGNITSASGTVTGNAGSFASLTVAGLPVTGSGGGGGGGTAGTFSSLVVTGPATVGSLASIGNATIGGSSTISGNLAVTGAGAVSSVNGFTTPSGVSAATVGATGTISAGGFTTPGTISAQTLNVTGQTTLLDVSSGNTVVNGTLTVGALNATSIAATGNGFIAGSLNVGVGLGTPGTVTVGTLGVTGGSNLFGQVVINNGLVVAGGGITVNTGVIEASGYQVQGATGTTCGPAAPGAGFQVLQGLVVHC